MIIFKTIKKRMQYIIHILKKSKKDNKFTILPKTLNSQIMIKIHSYDL